MRFQGGTLSKVLEAADFAGYSRASPGEPGCESVGSFCDTDRVLQVPSVSPSLLRVFRGSPTQTKRFRSMAAFDGRRLLCRPIGSDRDVRPLAFSVVCTIVRRVSVMDSIALSEGTSPTHSDILFEMTIRPSFETSAVSEERIILRAREIV